MRSCRPRWRPWPASSRVSSASNPPVTRTPGSRSPTGSTTPPRGTGNRSPRTWWPRSGDGTSGTPATGCAWQPWIATTGRTRSLSSMTWPVIDGLRTLELGFPGEQRDRLTGYVLHGRKRATAGVVAEYDEEGEPLEHVGERLVLVDSAGAEIGRVDVTEVVVRRFDEVDWA